MVFMLYICNTTKTINLIMKQDVQIFDLIRSERDRQSSGLELIASENYVSDYVLEASWPSTASASFTTQNMPTYSLILALRLIWQSKWL